MELKNLKDIKNSELKHFSLNGLKTEGKVVHVYDGDTCSIIFEYKNEIVKFRCRLNGINTPELNSSNKDEHEKAIICRNKLITLVTNVDTTLLTKNMSKKDIKNLLDTNTKLINIECFKFDKYGRLLVNLEDDNSKELLNEKIMD
jgi:endonuclease YncB( thermonuclease family)